MRNLILTAARDLLLTAGRPTVTLDEVAAAVGITLRRLHAWYTSITAIQRDLPTDDGGACRAVGRTSRSRVRCRALGDLVAAPHDADLKRRTSQRSMSAPGDTTGMDFAIRTGVWRWAPRTGGRRAAPCAGRTSPRSHPVPNPGHRLLAPRRLRPVAAQQF